MDTHILHGACQEFAALLSEVTVGDLRAPVPGAAGDIGDLLVEAVDELREASGRLPSHAGSVHPPVVSREALQDLCNVAGAGYDEYYRTHARGVVPVGDHLATYSGAEHSATSGVVDALVRTTVRRTHLLARALELDSEP